MTSQHLVSILLVLAGAAFMFVSIAHARKIAPSLPGIFQKRWRTLTVFMIFFFCGYLFFVAIQVSHLPIPVELVTGIVFLGGAVFVFLTILLSRQTVISLLEKDRLLQEANRHLEKRVQERTRALETESQAKKETAKKLDLLNTELSHILDTTTTGIRVIDTEFNVLRVNKSFCTMIGKSEEELIGHHCYKNFSDPSCKAGCGLQYIRDGKDKHEFLTEKVLMDGRTMHFHITAVPFRDSHGTLLGVVEDFQDITELVQEQKAREQMQVKLLHTSKLESVGQLSAGIAHEINTPIQFIGTNIDFIRDSFKDISHIVSQVKRLLDLPDPEGISQQQLESLATALEKADWDYLCQEIPIALEQTSEGIIRVSSIVQAMKEFSHPGSKEKVLADLNSILKNTLTISHNEWKYVADLKTDLDDNLPKVPCMIAELGQVFLNILMNAGHAIAEKQKESLDNSKGLITVSTRQADGFAEIRFDDTGSGIPADVIPKIFDPFFTTKEVGQGSGQGLAISYDVISKHGGTITADSTPGSGTSFILRLPLSL
ncbi:MAG: PAS domain-containing protein [Proteobacteria bacterium]|nr:PAS domain-containing protein [Pseudomonadota bacterium]